MSKRSFAGLSCLLGSIRKELESINYVRMLVVVPHNTTKESVATKVSDSIDSYISSKDSCKLLCPYPDDDVGSIVQFTDCDEYRERLTIDECYSVIILLGSAIQHAEVSLPSDGDRIIRIPHFDLTIELTESSYELMRDNEELNTIEDKFGSPIAETITAFIEKINEGNRLNACAGNPPMDIKYTLGFLQYAYRDNEQFIFAGVDVESQHVLHITDTDAGVMMVFKYPDAGHLADYGRSEVADTFSVGIGVTCTKLAFV